MCILCEESEARIGEILHVFYVRIVVGACLLVKLKYVFEQRVYELNYRNYKWSLTA
jgi:hypothetical protein